MTKGQLVERMCIIPAGGIVLDGIYLRGPEPPPLVVCGPHPLLGGTVDHPVPNEMAYAAAYAMHASVRFFWRGVGASQGARDASARATTEDLGHAVDYALKTTGAASAVVSGYQFGAAAVLRAVPEIQGVERVVLVSPPRDLVATDAIGEAPRPTLVIVGEEETQSDVAGLRRLAERPGDPVRAPLRVVVIPKADHTFRVGLAALGRAVAGWLKR